MYAQSDILSYTRYLDMLFFHRKHTNTLACVELAPSYMIVKPVCRARTLITNDRWCCCCFFFVFNIFLASLSACPWQKCVFRLDFQDKIKYCTMRCCLFGRFIWSHIMCTERETKRFLVLYDLFSIFLVVKADDSERIISAIFSSNLLLLLFVFTSCGIDYLTMEPHSEIQQQ